MSQADIARFNKQPTVDQRAQMEKLRQENEAKTVAAANAAAAATQAGTTQGK